MPTDEIRLSELHETFTKATTKAAVVPTSHTLKPLYYK